MGDSGLIKKLRLKEGDRALVLNPPAGYLEQLADLPAGVRLEQEAEGEFDFVHLFVKDSADLERLYPQARQAIKYDGVFWISYPKGSSGVKTDLNRDILWQKLTGKGIRPVTQIAIDEVWSALRFRPEEQVGR